MNTKTEKTREDGKQRRKSIGTPGSITRGSGGGGQGGGLTVSGGKTRRYSIGVTSSRKSSEEEEGKNNVVPNYLRASTGSCHDFCKYGKKHEQQHSKSAISVKFKRSTAVNKEKVTNTTVVSAERKTGIKKPSFTDPKIHQTPVDLTKKNVSNVSFPSEKSQISKRDGKSKENEVKLGQQSTSAVKRSPGSNESNGGVKKKDIRSVKKTGITPKDVKKVAVKSAPVVLQSSKASSFSRAASLKAIKHGNVKKVSPLKDQNRMQKPELKAESEAKSETIEFDYVQETVRIVDSPPVLSTELVNDPVSRNGLEKETHSEYESSKLYQEQEFLEEDSSMEGILEKSSSKLYQEQELLEEDSSMEGILEKSSSKLYQEQEFLEEDSSMEGILEKSSSKLYQEQEEDSSMEGILKKSESFSEVLEEDLLIAPSVSESSQSFYDDEVLEDESEFSDEEEQEQEESESSDNEKANNTKITRKGRMVISEEKDEEGVKLRFRRGRILDLQSENNNGPRRLKFRKGKVMEGNEERHHVSRRSFEKKYEKEKYDDSKNRHENVVLKHQGEQEKKDGQVLFNNVIEETASKLVESRKSKVKALVGAFETVISLQDGKP